MVGLKNGVATLENGFTATLENGLAASYKVKYTLNIWPSNSIPGYLH